MPYLKNYFYIFIFSVCLILAGFLNIGYVSAEPDNSTAEPIETTEVSSIKDELKTEIEKKNQALKELDGQISETKDQLESVKSQKQTLQGELNQISSNLKQLDLGIKLSQTSVEKFDLEIKGTQFEIKDSEDKIKNKKQAIATALQELQQKNGGDNFLMIILKNGSLANSVFEAQGLIDFQEKLANEINELKNFKDDLNNKLKLTATKKTAKQIESENLKNKKIIAQETKSYRQTLLDKTKNNEKIYQQTLTELQKQQNKIAEEIFNLEEDLGLRMDRSFLPSPVPGVLAVPIANPKITQNYGKTAFALSGAYKGKAHNGLDFGAPIGTPVLAAEKGKVISVANQDLYCKKGAYGKYVAIEHYNNLTTLYAHLSLWVVKEGNAIEKGQIIGYVGNTGYSTGAHLHFGVYSSQTFHIDSAKLNCGPKMPYGGTLNPADYLEL